MVLKKAKNAGKATGSATKGEPAGQENHGGRKRAAKPAQPRSGSAPAANPAKRQKGGPNAEPAPRSHARQKSSDGLNCARPGSKLAMIVAALQQKGGATIAEMAERTGWQKHSVHGAISGTLRTKRGLKIITEQRDGVHYYRLVG